MEVTDSEFSRQYQAKQNGELAFVEYSIQERKIFFTKTLLPESADEAFVAAVLPAARAPPAPPQDKVVPVCPAAIAFFKRNKEYKEVLSAGIRI